MAVALVLGTAGLPHILMRFFTVPNAKAARTSVGLGDGPHRRVLFDDGVHRTRRRDVRRPRQHRQTRQRRARDSLHHTSIRNRRPNSTPSFGATASSCPKNNSNHGRTAAGPGTRRPAAHRVRLGRRLRDDSRGRRRADHRGVVGVRARYLVKRRARRQGRRARARLRRAHDRRRFRHRRDLLLDRAARRQRRVSGRPRLRGRRQRERSAAALRACRGSAFRAPER